MALDPFSFGDDIKKGFEKDLDLDLPG